ncbi:hypothetical protein EH228_17270 [Erwinia endophytica]|uniref:hypothetical protein n=1 Tax=Erwinia endophytica TaxID=1563158 RepID=UPI001265DE5C|nr:hypothetical protein [Erwinia endophytica]KAB8306712.1 hypothetical protein EH228_17270 [Erwinia endophytica]
MLGVIGLDTGFPKYPGHVRNPSTFRFPITVEAVKGATTERLVGQADASLEDLFVGAAKRLVDQGATVITGGCGYMILFQKAIAAAGFCRINDSRPAENALPGFQAARR